MSSINFISFHDSTVKDLALCKALFIHYHRQGDPDGNPMSGEVYLYIQADMVLCISERYQTIFQIVEDGKIEYHKVWNPEFVHCHGCYYTPDVMYNWKDGFTELLDGSVEDGFHFILHHHRLGEEHKLEEKIE